MRRRGSCGRRGGRVEEEGSHQHLFHGVANVLATDGLDEVVEARLVDGQVVAVPRVDLLFRKVHHRHLNAGRLERNDGHRRPADVASTHAADLDVVFRLLVAEEGQREARQQEETRVRSCDEVRVRRP